jgi:hypothetical protein
MIDSFGDVGTMIEQARPDSLAKLYRDLRLEVRNRHAMDGGEASPQLVWLTSVSEGDSNTCSQHPCDKQGSCVAPMSSRRRQFAGRTGCGGL